MHALRPFAYTMVFLLVAPALPSLAVDVSSERARDAVWGRDPIAESEAQFGVLPRSQRRWAQQNPTGHNVDSMGGDSMIGLLSRMQNRSLGRARWQMGLEPRIARARQFIEGGLYDSAYQRVLFLAKWGELGSQAQVHEIYDLMGELAAAYVEAGNVERATGLYEEMLLLGRCLSPGHTGAALNTLIATHFERGEYETALMYVRVGIAVLDDVGIEPYRAMNRIIAEMSNPETAVGALEQDFDAALVRLESAVARGEEQGLVVEDQWWAPVYRARHDREEAIRVFRTMLAPMRDGPRDILRDDTEHEELTR